jgi:hypothetical protein
VGWAVFVRVRVEGWIDIPRRIFCPTGEISGPQRGVEEGHKRRCIALVWRWLGASSDRRVRGRVDVKKKKNSDCVTMPDDRRKNVLTSWHSL